MQNLVVETIDRFLVAKNTSLVQNLIQNYLVKRPDPSSCGAVFDQLIAVAMRNAAQKGLTPSFFKPIPWASGCQWTGSKSVAMLEPFESTLASGRNVCTVAFCAYFLES